MKITSSLWLDDDVGFCRTVFDHGHSVDRLTRVNLADGTVSYWLNAAPITMEVYAAFEAIALSVNFGA